MAKTAIIYARVSTPGQAEEDLPVESQLATCRRKAAEMDAVVLREFIDAGISGRTDDRPAFRDALAFCKVNQVDHFICWNTSRFARNHIDAGWHKLQIGKHGTTMAYSGMSLDSSTKEGWMMESILEVVDEYYSRQISADTSRSMMKNAQDGFFNGGGTPFGYEAIAVGKRRRLAIVEHEAVIVRGIFAEVVAGHGVISIANRLRELGCTRRGAPWSKNTINNLLRNWVMCGYVVFNRRAHNTKTTRPESDWVKVRSFPAIIDEEQFMIVQSTLTSRAPARGRGSPKSTHFFTGMVKCGECGAAMMIQTATGRSKLYEYYNCGSSMRAIGCGPRRISADAFDTWMADYILTQVMSIENLRLIAGDIEREAGQWAKQRVRRREAFVSELRGIEGRRKRIYNLLETQDRDALNLKDIKPRLMELNDRALTIERSLTALELEEPQSAVRISDLVELQEFVRDVVLSSNNPTKIREFFAGFVSEIVLTGTDARINYRKDRLVTANVTSTVRSENGWLPDRVLRSTASLVVILPDRFRRAA